MHGATMKTAPKYYCALVSVKRCMHLSNASNMEYIKL